jgi:hypothetical protein
LIGVMGKKVEKKSREEPAEIECTINLGSKLVKVYVQRCLGAVWSVVTHPVVLRRSAHPAPLVRSRSLLGNNLELSEKLLQCGGSFLTIV